ncbi:MAG: peptidoglycan editing factor PgeF [Halioglobus sp.]|nr:peptidoglycan editing factor PgeF [Halioglobus sp.]
MLALCTTRQGGVSLTPYDTLNLGMHVGDAAASVEANRARLAARMPAGIKISWLQQVHGIDVVAASTTQYPPEADAQWSDRPGIACAVLTADCLPVLFCSRSGHRVGAAHAGWRGLAAGVLEATVRAMDTEPGELLAWLGPAIGPATFEVGEEVQRAFVATAGATVAQTRAAFRQHPEREDHYFADLYALARLRLEVAGVTAVFGGDLCTYLHKERFFSYRRDGSTGRMVSLISIVPVA